MQKQKLEHCFSWSYDEIPRQHTKVKAICAKLCVGDWHKVPSSDLYVLQWIWLDALNTQIYLHICFQFYGHFNLYLNYTQFLSFYVIARKVLLIDFVLGCYHFIVYCVHSIFIFRLVMRTFGWWLHFAKLHFSLQSFSLCNLFYKNF